MRPDEARALEKVRELVEPHYASIEPMQRLSFEEIKRGIKFEIHFTPLLLISQAIKFICPGFRLNTKHSLNGLEQ